MTNLNSFVGSIEWVEEEVLPAIEENYVRETSSFAIGLIALENDGSVLSEITPRPIVAEDSTVSDVEEQQSFAEMTRVVLNDCAASGVIVIVFAPNEDNEDRVVVSLEHKTGRATWIAVGQEEKINKFVRTDEYDWYSEFGFADMLPTRILN
jgi:hypothetical protein